MKKASNIIIVSAILLVLIITDRMYIDLFEWFFILFSCLTLTSILGRRIAKNKNKISWGLLTIVAFCLYIGLTLFDIVGDYVISKLTLVGPQDGIAPPLSYVIKETYDDFMLLNLIAPILIGLVAASISEIKVRKSV
ncbi:hypothetical protein R9X47_27995 [Wukongibacter baidiensis]|uniref:hypothetical protein n=1 Tax=Wukongibacter baidiensis TaxID=1723361 RepID=UPI003D7F3B5B